MRLFHSWVCILQKHMLKVNVWYVWKMNIIISNKQLKRWKFAIDLCVKTKQIEMYNHRICRITNFIHSFGLFRTGCVCVCVGFKTLESKEQCRTIFRFLMSENESQSIYIPNHRRSILQMLLAIQKNNISSNMDNMRDNQ